ncbi:peroxiredoxin [Caulobacter sp. 73W]|uniref:thioredoxin-dependent peroxiredoxin n=1 Tax=Caulobacter sp. 73W TaxID=3161137 RepID=A0AB39KUH5_9CAUL
MKRLLACAALITAIASPAFAALPVGAKAPDFTAEGALAGKPFKFHLAEALKKGPVVLYFFPSAFTKGCTIEAHEFAEAADDFSKAGATLIGVTAGNTDRLAEFSKEACRDKFPVAAVNKDTIKAYDAVLALKPDLSDRTSYVIGKNGKVAFVHSDLNPVDHIKLTLKAAQDLKAKK